MSQSSLLLIALPLRKAIQVYFNRAYDEIYLLSVYLIGFVEGDGGVSIEAAHAMRNTSIANITWTELPGYGKTLSGITPWPRTGSNFGNFTAGSGPSM